jgi:hypothetical protein
MPSKIGIFKLAKLDRTLEHMDIGPRGATEQRPPETGAPNTAGTKLDRELRHMEVKKPPGRLGGMSI